MSGPETHHISIGPVGMAVIGVWLIASTPVLLLGRLVVWVVGGEAYRRDVDLRRNVYFVFDHEVGEYVEVQPLGERWADAPLHRLLVWRGRCVVSPPGERAMRLVRLVYSAKSVERVFDPIYSDFWYEYVDALDRGQVARRFFIVLRYYVGLTRAASLFGLVRLVKSATEYWQTIR